jgi:hypothetical protein
LIYEILRQQPDLIPIVLPLRWARMYTSSISQFRRQPELLGLYPPYLLRDLMEAFKVLVHQTSIPLKICLFIDGLDEFDGDHEEIAQLFKSVAGLANVKVCLSSRP